MVDVRDFIRVVRRKYESATDAPSSKRVASPLIYGPQNVGIFKSIPPLHASSPGKGTVFG